MSNGKPETLFRYETIKSLHECGVRGTLAYLVWYPTYGTSHRTCARNALFAAAKERGLKLELYRGIGAIIDPVWDVTLEAFSINGVRILGFHHKATTIENPRTGARGPGYGPEVIRPALLEAPELFDFDPVTVKIYDEPDYPALLDEIARLTATTNAAAPAA